MFCAGVTASDVDMPTSAAAPNPAASAAVKTATILDFPSPIPRTVRSLLLVVFTGVEHISAADDAR